MISYLELKQILAMHESLIGRYGGGDSLGPAKLDPRYNRGEIPLSPRWPLIWSMGEELFPDVPSKAAAYAFYISENQPFLDGNKRMATASALTFLRLNGFDLKLSVPDANREIYDTIMKVANKEMTRDDLVAWFRKNSRKKKTTTS